MSVIPYPTAPLQPAYMSQQPAHAPPSAATTQQLGQQSLTPTLQQLQSPMAPLIPTGFMHGDHGLVPVYDPVTLSQYMVQHSRTPDGAAAHEQGSEPPTNFAYRVPLPQIAPPLSQSNVIYTADPQGVRASNSDSSMAPAQPPGFPTWRIPMSASHPAVPSYTFQQPQLPSATWGHHQNSVHQFTTNHLRTEVDFGQRNTRNRPGKNRPRRHLSEGGITVAEPQLPASITFPSIHDPRPVEGVPLHYPYQVDDWSEGRQNTT